MGQLFAFLYKYRAFFTFLILELFCLWLIVGHNDYQRNAYFKTTAGLVGRVNQTADNVGDYFGLKQVNTELAQENARLRQLLLQRPKVIIDSTEVFAIETDSTDSVQYILRAAEIVNNSIRQSHNFFMINKGEKDGIQPGMGVINQRGIVGKIRSVSANFSVGISLLNARNQVSAKHKNSGRFATIQWDGDSRDPRHVQLLYVTREVSIAVGDSILTSGFSTLYPKDLLIGTVASVAPDPNQRDLKVDVALSVDFGKLAYVYVIENVDRQEIDSLATNIPIKDNE
uniref:rod shape-determining protein MreC n=1 Tax=Roseivirga sp. TaxID=1964215 RepID=UPI00404860B0